MAKTLVDLDETLLSNAAAALGTTTKKDTIVSALEAVVAAARRRAHLARFDRDGLPDLRDPDVMDAAWR